MRIAIVVAGLVAGCTAEGVPRCNVEPDELRASPEGVVVIADESGVVRDVVDGEALPIRPVPGGGRYIFVSARARNLRSGKGRIRAVLWVGEVQQVLFVDEREVDLVSAADCWLHARVSSPYDFNPVQMCPLAWGGTLEREAILSVTVSDDEGQAVTANVRVLPVCADDDPLCPCQCARDHQPGAQCP